MKLHGLLAVGLGTMAYIAGCARASNDGPVDDPPPPPPPATTYQVSRPPSNDPPRSSDAPKNPFHDGPPVQVADPAHVDPVELLPQARKVALGFDEHAVLTEIIATKIVTAGVVDVTGDDGVTFRFEWLYFDKSRPPGRDKVDMSISARRGRFSVMELYRASLLSLPREHRPDPAPDPRCSARDAWKAAVRSGVPENAVASMRYVGAFPGGRGCLTYGTSASRSTTSCADRSTARRAPSGIGRSGHPGVGRTDPDKKLLRFLRLDGSRSIEQ